MKVGIEFIEARLRAPFVSARGSIDVRRLLLLRLEDAGGNVGFGEAAPLESYDGVGIDRARAALEDVRPLLSDSTGLDHAELVRECSSVAVLPQAIAAIDVALWDLAARRSEQPLWRLLGAQQPAPVMVNWTIASADRAGAAREAAAARASGFSAVKVKVGLEDDPGRLAAVRAGAGPEMAIRIDANGAWSVDEALRALGALAPIGIELCEEPVRGVDGIAAVSAKSGVPIALDESARAPHALTHQVCSAVCLKVASCGGISGVLRAACLARTAGYEIYLASTLEGPVGIAAALHAAALIQPDRACGLATLGLFQGREDPLAPTEGRIVIPGGRGLGDGLMAWYRST